MWMMSTTEIGLRGKEEIKEEEKETRRIRRIRRLTEERSRTRKTTHG